MADGPPQPAPGCYFTMDHVPQVQVQAHKHSISVSAASSATASSSASTFGFSMTSDSTPSTPLVNASQISSIKSTHSHKNLQVDANGQPLDVLSRIYPKPQGELSVEEALALAPLPGTFRHLAQRSIAEKALTSEEKRADLERIKRELRGGSLNVKKK